MAKLHKSLFTLDENNIGKPMYEWITFDYHPHNRGWLWYVITTMIIVAILISLFFLSEDVVSRWISILSFVIGVSAYAYIHRKSQAVHRIFLFSKGILIDRSWYEWEQFHGFWFILDRGTTVLNLEVKDNGKTKNISLQLGDQPSDKISKILTDLGLDFLPDHKEPVIDLWLRILKI